MRAKEIIPWRIRHKYDQWLEKHLRPANHRLYKFIKLGRTNINTPKYWNRVWKTDSINRDYQELFQIICDHIPIGSNVLDVGCGIGNLARFMRDSRSAKVTALDFSSYACSILASEGFRTIISKLPTIPVPDESYDVAVCTEVLEHLDHPERTLAQMIRVVRHGGVVICSAPDNALHPHKELEHQIAYTLQSFEQTLKATKCNFEIMQLSPKQSGHHRFLLAVLHRA
jgi:2-polyprenyl-3-methyl-5-hydroxy-6-metoxy-1,4-benzoquinol methylase